MVDNRFNQLVNAMAKPNGLDEIEAGELVRYHSLGDCLHEDQTDNSWPDPLVNIGIKKPNIKQKKMINLPVASSKKHIHRQLSQASESTSLSPSEQAQCDSDKISSELSNFVQKKSMAQGMMDLALLSANTNQLRYVIDLENKHPYYSLSMFLILTSLILQVVVGLTMLYVSRLSMRSKREIRAAEQVNNLSVLGVFLITLINVFISTFNGVNSVSHLQVPDTNLSDPALATYADI